MNKFINLAIAGTMLLGFSSCLKDDGYDEGTTGHDLSGVPKIIEIGFKDNTAKTRTYGLDFVNEAIEQTIVNVRLAAAAPASEDIVVTVDTTGTYTKLQSINAAYQVLPTSFYTSNLTGGKVTIAKGTRETPIVIKTNASQFNPSVTYGLYFKVTAVDKNGYNLSSFFNEYVVLLGAKNNYDGVYEVVSGFVQRYSAPGVPTVGDNLNGSLVGNPDVFLITADANSNNIPLPGTGALAWAAVAGSYVAGIDGLKVTIDPTSNLTTMSSTLNLTLANWIGKPNFYDPATRTFTLNFDWNQTANRREYSVVLKYRRAR